MQALSSIATRQKQRPTASITPSNNGFLANDRGLSETEQMMCKLANSLTSTRAKQMVLQHLSTGGKRIRARLALAAIEALGSDRVQAFAWAAAVELLHNASLVHDDIQDRDRMRRGEPTLWVRHGKAQAINAGDMLLMLPFLAVNELPTDASVRANLSELLARRAADTVSGQVEELEMLSEKRLTFAEYVAMVRKKTGELLALPVQGAALLAGKDPEKAKAIADQFIDLGTLFQLQDDILDLYGDKGRGHVGSDLYEGKVSALVVAYLHIHPEEREWLLSLLEKDRDEIPLSEIKRAIEKFRNSGALDFVISFINQIIDQLNRSTPLQDEPGLHRVAMELCIQALKPIKHVIESQEKQHEQNRCILALTNRIELLEMPC